MRSLIVGLVAALILSGCGASIRERHHFATVNRDTREIVNIFRVTVKGDIAMANARYLAGFYDERAVDLFFNEVKAGDLTTKGVGSIFTMPDCTGKTEAECIALKNARLSMVPIGTSTAPDGAFVMILSTDADAIAGTIGAFAENETVVGSAMYLATRSEREEAASITARAGVVTNTRNAAATELSALFAKATDDLFEGADQKEDMAARTRLYLAILQAAAAGLTADAAPTFTSVQEARAWYAARPRSVAE